jgi:hypothetical protein
MPYKEGAQTKDGKAQGEANSNPLVLADPVLDMPGAHEFCTRVPCMAGEEVYESLKRTQICLLELKRSLIGLTRLIFHIQEVQDVV